MPRPPVTRRFTTAALVAAATIVLTIVWAAVMLVPLTDEVGAFPRTDVPGEMTVTIDEADGHVVYYERQTWFAATPMNPQLEVEVTDADNQAVSTSAYEPPLQYRMPGLVGEAAATFDPPRAGNYTVAIDTTDAADPLPDDARVAVGPSVAGRVAGGLIGPIVLLLGGLVAAAVIAIRAAAGRPDTTGSPVGSDATEQDSPGARRRALTTKDRAACRSDEPSRSATAAVSRPWFVPLQSERSCL